MQSYVNFDFQVVLCSSVLDLLDLLHLHQNIDGGPVNDTHEPTRDEAATKSPAGRSASDN